VNAPPDRWEGWVTWCSEHPRTVLYLVVVTTLNLIVNVVEMVMS
jgi:hypothetical protein